MRESMKHLTAFTAYFSFNQKCKKRVVYVGCIPVKITEMHTQLVKNPPAMKETLVRSLGWKIRWRRERLPTLVFLGFPGISDRKESTCNAGDLGLIPGLGSKLNWETLHLLVCNLQIFSPNLSFLRRWI